MSRNRQDEKWPVDRQKWKAVVLKIVDGDTVDLAVDVGFMLHVHERFRLAGIDAPETRGSERPEGLAAKEYLEQVMPAGATVWVQSTKRGSFRRWLADIFLTEESNESVSEMMLAHGYAERYER